MAYLIMHHAARGGQSSLSILLLRCGCQYSNGGAEQTHEDLPRQLGQKVYTYTHTHTTLHYLTTELLDH